MAQNVKLYVALGTIGAIGTYLAIRAKQKKKTGVIGAAQSIGTAVAGSVSDIATKIEKRKEQEAEVAAAFAAGTDRKLNTGEKRELDLMLLDKYHTISVLKARDQEMTARNRNDIHYVSVYNDIFRAGYRTGRKPETAHIISL